MVKFNVYRPINSILFLVILLLTACAQQPSKSKHFKTRITPPVVTFPKQDSKPLPEKAKAPEPESKQIVKTPQQILPPKDIWERIFRLYALPEYQNPRVQKEINRYSKNPEYLEKIQRRAAPFLYMIVEEIEKKGIPGELALLPVVESAFLPSAYSHSHAAGIWQFIPPTGRLFGLKQNWWYDGRRDIYASTQAATTYLKQLAELFNGDWLLALASYNGGKGRVGKAIRYNKKRQKPTNYWSLRLPRETMEYVPRLLAVAKIFAHAEQYNLKLIPIPNRPTVELVDIGAQLDLTKAAEMAALSTDDFFRFNPGFKQWHSDPKGPHHLLIPIEKSQYFKTNLAKLPKKDRVLWRRHKIKSGENLIVIARKYKTSVPAIRAANKLPSNRIRAGHHLLIPLTYRKNQRHPLMPPPPVYGTDSITYTVKRGDTFWHIARKYSVSSKKIAAWNNIRLHSILRPGQKLVIHPRKHMRKISNLQRKPRVHNQIAPEYTANALVNFS